MTEVLYSRRNPHGQTGTTLISVLFLALALFPATCHSSQWRVIPARMFLDREAKSSTLTVINEGDERITLQAKAMEWSQDAEGRDVYRESNDIVFFPKILIIDKGEQKIMRTGIKIPAAAREKTYRLFVEEIPQPKKEDQGERAQIAITIRFGVPIFVKPLKEELKGEVIQPTLVSGVFTTAVKNSGNAHFKITAITIKGENARGEETFSTKLDGWYLLSGAARTYSAPIPQEKCAGSSRLTIEAETDKKITLHGNLNVEKGQCLP